MYNKLVQRKPHGTRPTDNETMEMLKGIMHKDPNTRTLFEIKNEVAQPQGVDDLVKLIRQMLRARKTAADLDNMTFGVAPNLSAFTTENLHGLLALGQHSPVPLEQVHRALAVLSSSSTKSDPRVSGGGRPPRGNRPPPNKRDLKSSVKPA